MLPVKPHHYLIALIGLRFYHKIRIITVIMCLQCQMLHVSEAHSTSVGQKVLLDRREGKSHRKSHEVGACRKSLKMTWCLSEALLDQHRKHMLKAQSVCLSQDLKGTLSTLRFTMAGLQGFVANNQTTIKKT